MLKFLTTVLGVAVALAATITPATSGGWAAVSLEEPITQVDTGRETQVWFRVLAHNNPDTPIPRMDTEFELTHKKSGEQFVFHGAPTSDPNVYWVTIRVDTEGAWTWKARILNFGDGGPLTTSLPDFFAVAPGAGTTPLASPVAETGTRAVVTLNREPAARNVQRPAGVAGAFTAHHRSRWNGHLGE
jgi:hypothetical protein